MLLEQIRASIREALDKRAALQEERDAILVAVEARGDGALTSDEEAAFNAKRDALRAADDHLTALKAREAELVEDEVRRTAAESIAAELPAARPATTVRAGRPELTYRQDGEHSFVSDVWASRWDRGAAERLERNTREQRGEFGVESRDVGTSAFTGFVIPQYLVDLYAELARAGAPVLNTIPAYDLPAEGMVVNVGRITTGSAVAEQASENSAVQETNIDDTLLAIDVRTYAGQQDVSRQALERGTMVESLVMADLMADYWTKLDAAIINGAGTSGTHLGILQVSSISDTDYTDASPTVAELWPKLANAVQKVPSNRYAPATIIYMHPRRWGWFAAALDSQNRPLFGSYDVGNAVNSMAVGKAGEYGQVVGTLMGLPVVSDANIPTNLGTNEDAIIVARNLDFVFLREGDGSPRFLRFEETTGGSLTTKLVVYGYSAFAAGRQPKSISTVTDTGLITPTF